MPLPRPLRTPLPYLSLQKSEGREYIVTSHTERFPHNSGNVDGVPGVRRNKSLAKNLPGYAEYCAKARWHLIPGIF